MVLKSIVLSPFILLLLMPASFGELPNRESSQQSIGQLLDRVVPTLEKTVALIERHRSLPKASINPFDVDQRSNQADIDELLEKAIGVLEISHATEIRDRLRSLQDQNRASMLELAELRRKKIAAPLSKDLSRLQKVNPLVTSREQFEELVSAEESKIADRKNEANVLREEFQAELSAIGINLDRHGIEALLGSISGDEYVSMITVFQNIKAITAQLEQLTDESGESIVVARRYYGMYVVLLQAMDHLQTKFTTEIASQHVPKLKAFAKQAEINIDEANTLIRSGKGAASVLRANIAANKTTKHAAELYIQHLQENAKTVSRANAQTKVSLATAENTYRTVRLSGEVIELIRTGQQRFDTLMQLHLPTMREFGNETIKKELQRMTLELRAD